MLAEKIKCEELHGRHLIIGLSGGADSMSLTHYLSVCPERDWTMEAVHLNHLLRGEESERDEQAVRDFCRTLHLPLKVYRLDIAALSAERHLSEETCGREERYRLFAEVAGRAREGGLSPVIVTAHTLSDDLETILLHLVRGCGLDGLCGIPQRRILEDGTPLLRPLLGVSREEVEGYCAAQKLSFVTDSSNLSDIYTRNFLRLQVLPELKKLNPALEKAALRMKESLMADRAFLEQQTDLLLEKAERENGWDASILSAADPALRRRAEGRLLQQQGLQQQAHTVKALDAVVSGRKKGFSVGAVRYQLRGGCLRAERESRIEAEPVLSPLAGGRCSVWLTERDCDGKLLQKRAKSVDLQLISVKEYLQRRKVYKNLLYFAIDYDTIKNNVVLRTRAPGDFIRLPGNGGRKLLKKQLQEAHLSAAERKEMLLLADGAEVIWTERFGVSAAFRPGEKTCRVLLVLPEGTLIDKVFAGV